MCVGDLPCRWEGGTTIVGRREEVCLVTDEVKIAGTASVCQIVKLPRGFILIETFDVGVVVLAPFY